MVQRRPCARAWVDAARRRDLVGTGPHVLQRVERVIAARRAVSRGRSATSRVEPGLPPRAGRRVAGDPERLPLSRDGALLQVTWRATERDPGKSALGGPPLDGERPPAWFALLLRDAPSASESSDRHNRRRPRPGRHPGGLTVSRARRLRARLPRAGRHHRTQRAPAVPRPRPPRPRRTFRRPRRPRRPARPSTATTDNARQPGARRGSAPSYRAARPRRPPHARPRRRRRASRHRQCLRREDRPRPARSRRGAAGATGDALVVGSAGGCARCRCSAGGRGEGPGPAATAVASALPGTRGTSSARRVDVPPAAWLAGLPLPRRLAAPPRGWLTERAWASAGSPCPLRPRPPARRGGCPRPAPTRAVFRPTCLATSTGLAPPLRRRRPAPPLPHAAWERADPGTGRSAWSRSGSRRRRGDPRPRRPPRATAAPATPARPDRPRTRAPRPAPRVSGVVGADRQTRPP